MLLIILARKDKTVGLQTTPEWFYLSTIAFFNLVMLFIPLYGILTLRKISETRINVVILGRIKRKTQEVWLRRYWIYIQTI